MRRSETSRKALHQKKRSGDGEGDDDLEIRFQGERKICRHANIEARPQSSTLLKALQLANPRAVTLPNAYLDRDIPQRATYARLWEQVKAA